MNREKIKSLFRSCLFSFVLIPVSDPKHFLDLQYKKLKPNKVQIAKTVSINVDKSASPLFIKSPEVQVYDSVELMGKVKINNEIKGEGDDSYFQLGVIYEGSYRPNSFIKNFLPEWLIKVLSISDKHGVSEIDFHAISPRGMQINKSDSIRDIKLNFKTRAYLNHKNHFQMKVKLKPKKVLGFWLRADGDDTNAHFKTILDSLKINRLHTLKK